MVSSTPVGNPHKTENPHTPLIYKNGFGSVAIDRKPIAIAGLSKMANRLRFDAVLGPSYTQAAMFENFGKWTKIEFVDLPRRGKAPAYTKAILTWENVRLLDDDETLYTVVCDGEESYEEMYASVMVFDQSLEDQLQEGSGKIKSIVAVFSEMIQNLGSSAEFYKMVGEQINAYKRKRR